MGMNKKLNKVFRGFHKRQTKQELFEYYYHLSKVSTTEELRELRRKYTSKGFRLDALPSLNERLLLK